MPRLSKSQERARVELAALDGKNLTPGEVAAESMSALQRAIGWDGFRLFGVDSQTLLINRLLAASDNDGWARKEWLEKVYLVDDAMPYIQLPEILRSGLKGIAYQEQQQQSWGYPASLLEGVTPLDHWRYFHESRSPIGGVLVAGFGGNGRWVAALQAYRRERGAAFQPGDVDFLRRSGSLIGTALWKSLERERRSPLTIDGPSRAPKASGVMLLGPDGETRFATPAAQDWLEILGSGERVRAGLLPTPLWAAMLGLRRQPGHLESHIVQTNTGSGMVQIEATPAGQDGMVAIVIERARPAPSPSIPETWALTDQQRTVAMLIASGRTNREIASSLFLSENTVETHIRQIFQRLEIRSRQELIVRYFRESGMGAYADPDIASEDG